MSLFPVLKHYSLIELVLILSYKFVYKCVLFFEKIKLNFFKSNYQICFKTDTLLAKKYKSIESKIGLFYNLCSDNVQSIKEIADRIIDGQLQVFEYEFLFDCKKDWLKDPISGFFWDESQFFASAPYRQIGCHDVKYVLEVNKMNHLVVLALAYYHTENEKYIEQIDKELTGWLSCVPFERSVVNRIMMDLAFRAINLIQISLLCQTSEIFIKKVHPIIYGILTRFEYQIRKFSTPRWYKTGNGDNHVTGEMIGLIITQLWLQQFNGKNYSKHIKIEFKYLNSILKKTISPSGVYLEQSANYSRVVLEFLIIFDLFIKTFYLDNKNTRKYLSEKYLERLFIYVKDISYHNILPNFGDNDHALVLISFMDNERNIEYLFKYKNYLDLDIVDQNNVRGNYLDGSQWLYKSKNVYLFTRIGPLAYNREGAGVHAHNDLLSIILFAKGSSVFIDRGCLFYNMGNEVRKNYLMTSSHNSVSFKDIEMADIIQRGYCNYPKSKVISTEVSDSSCSFIGELIYKGINHTRSIDFDDDTITITDCLNTQKSISEGSISFLLSESLELVKNEFHCLSFTDNLNGNIIEINVIGVSKLLVENVSYYPSFGIERTTNRIIGTFEFNKQHSIKTIIKI